MSELSPVYNLAEHVHTTLFGGNEFVKPEEVAAAGVSRTTAGRRSTQTVAVDGQIDGNHVRQSLVREADGFHLNTVHLMVRDSTATLAMEHIRPDAPLEQINVVTGSLLMDALVGIGNPVA